MSVCWAGQIAVEITIQLKIPQHTKLVTPPKPQYSEHGGQWVRRVCSSPRSSEHRVNPAQIWQLLPSSNTSRIHICHQLKIGEFLVDLALD